MKPFSYIAALTLLATGTSFLAAADIDYVTRKSDGKIFGGEISAVSKAEVVVSQKVGNKEEHIPANDIGLVEWKGEPSSLTAGRSHERSGNLSEALEAYQEALSEAASGSEGMRGSIEYLITRVAVRVAKSDPTQVGTALQKLKDFVNKYNEHYRYYDAQLLLAELALSANDTAVADTSYMVLEKSPWTDYQLAGKNGQGFSRLAQNDIAGARRVFTEVAQSQAANPEENARRLEGMIGQAECLERESKYDEAVTILNSVVQEARAADSRILALAYLKQGDCLAADGQHVKPAILAYLHVDVIPSLAAHADLHAEALYNLSKLWLAVNQPQRSADASNTLQTNYNTSEWAQKLNQ
ncbi:MAG: hypothetical protein R3C18_11785 [Planctomycetaceae bacterium]